MCRRVTVVICVLAFLLSLSYGNNVALAADITVNISASGGWQNTGVSVQSGQFITIQASGLWSHGAEGVCCGPNPYDANGYRDKYDSNALLPSHRVGALIGRIAGGAPFFVGTNQTFTATSSGNLELGMNDRPSFFGDNYGGLTVRISIGNQGAVPVEPQPNNPPQNAVTYYDGWGTPRYATDSVRVLVERLRIRTGPGTSYPILGYAVNGDYYVLLNMENLWGNVRTASGQEGWVFLGDGFATVILNPNRRETVIVGVEPYEGFNQDLFSFLGDCVAKGGLEFLQALYLIANGASPSLALQSIPPEDAAACVNSAYGYGDDFFNWVRERLP